MITLKCKTCKKEVQGYSKKHAEHLMYLHESKHRKEDKNKEKEE